MACRLLCRRRVLSGFASLQTVKKVKNKMRNSMVFKYLHRYYFTIRGLVSQSGSVLRTASRLSPASRRK